MRRIGALVAALLVVAVVVAVAATRHAHPADGSPIDPGGGWTVAWVAALVVATAAYGAGVVLARRGAVSLRLAATVAAVVQLAPLAAPLLLSRDVYLYWAEARVAVVHHANPYRVTPSRYPEDPGTRAASVQWRTQTEPYGPGWVALGSVPVAVAGGSARRAELLYRVLAVIGIGAALAVVARRTRNAASVAFLGWSPLIAVHFAGGGHMDAWVALALVTAVAWRGTATGAAAWSLGSSLKIVPGILLPLELARGRLRFPRRFWLTLVLVELGVLIASTVAFGPHWATASAIGAHGSSPIGGVHALVALSVRHRYAVVAGAVVFAAVYVALLRHAWRTGRARLSLAATALCLCASLLRPWYAIWPVALAAVERDGVAQLAAFALSVYVLYWDAVPL